MTAWSQCRWVTSCATGGTVAGCSQMDLALDVGVSPRHLSFVETGRSRPSPELVRVDRRAAWRAVARAQHLLLAAGYAPRYRAARARRPGDAVHRRASVQRMLDAHDPYPGVVDRPAMERRARQRRRRAAHRRAAPTPARPAAERVPGVPPPRRAGGAHRCNFPEWATYLLGQLARRWRSPATLRCRRCSTRSRRIPNVAAVADWHDAAAGRRAGAARAVAARPSASVELSLFTTLTTFGTPQDITLDELAVELFFPADDATEALLRAGAG